MGDDGVTRLGATVGCLHRTGMDLQGRIRALRSLGLDGIEINFGEPAEVEAVDTAAIAALVQDLAFTTVHAPIRGSFTADDPGSIALLERLEAFRDSIGASVIVLHPPKLPSLRFATDHATVAIENMQARKGFDAEDLAAFIDGWDGPLVLDTCHAATWGEDSVRDLFDRYGDRCHHVHLSAYGEEEHKRMVDHPGFMERVAPLVQGHDIILENRCEDLEDLAEEVDFVRRALDLDP